jgi:hypothetical protein
MLSKAKSGFLPMCSFVYAYITSFVQFGHVILSSGSNVLHVLAVISERCFVFNESFAGLLHRHRWGRVTVSVAVIEDKSV